MVRLLLKILEERDQCSIVVDMFYQLLAIQRWSMEEQPGKGKSANERTKHKTPINYDICILKQNINRVWANAVLLNQNTNLCSWEFYFLSSLGLFLMGNFSRLSIGISFSLGGGGLEKCLLFWEVREEYFFGPMLGASPGVGTFS